MLLLEENTTRKKQVNEKTLSELEIELEFQVRNNKEYKVETIINSIKYSKLANNKILSLYYLICGNAIQKKNT